MSLASSVPPADAPSAETNVPVLLTMPTYGGTLAAARCLGAHGISVTMAGETLLAPAYWSRHVSRRVRCPDPFETERFYQWLIDFGKREPVRHVLYPTCDDLAWLFASRAEELGTYFRLYAPGVATILDLLDKKALYFASKKAGVGVVPTEFPRDRREALEMARELAFPMLLKPRTQIQFPGHKGLIVDRFDQFTAAYDRFVSGAWPPACGEFVKGVEIPMLQEYLPQANDGIYSVAGFMGRAHQQIAVRASHKILQRPRRIGVGLCFEEATVDHEVLERLVRLCRTSGYYGVFEAEFVPRGTQRLLIDFNPRFYGQMGFEVERQLPLGYLAWLGAMGDEAGVDREIAAAREWREGRGYAYYDSFFLGLHLFAQGVSGRTPLPDVQRWRRWKRDHRRSQLLVDAVGRDDDPVPRFVAATREVYQAIRHPRSFVLDILDA